jgi:hypothetical protein
VTQFLKLGDEALGRAVGVAFLEVVVAEIAVGLAGGEYVPVRDQHRVLHRVQRAAVPDPGT